MAPHPDISNDPQMLSPLAVHDLHLEKRSSGYQISPSQGSQPADAFNNVGIQVLFALIGVGMVLTAMWFFFWAKNGGFKWREGDWEDYKSTVLRRKGPDGKTLSNATKSTKLGGGSVVHGGSYGAESSVGYTDETGTSVDRNEMREVEEGNGRLFGLRGGDARSKKNRRDHTNDWKDPELRDYRHEKPARVGGLNRAADGMYTDYSATEPSELGSNVSGRPLVKSKDKKDQKKEAKEKERRAKERMRKAKAAEKEAAKTAAAEAKAQKESEKQKAKQEKAEQKKAKKSKRAESEAPQSEYPATEYPATEYPATEYPATEYPATEYPVTEYPATEYTDSPAKIEAKPPTEKSGLLGPRRAPPSAAYSFTTGDDTGTVYTGVYTDDRTAPSENNESSYYSDYRPNADPSVYTNRRSNRDGQDRRTRESKSRTRESQSRTRQSSSSPRKQHRSSRQGHSKRAPSDIFTTANGDVQGTISYPCHIPGLSSAGSVGVSESVSQVGAPSSGRRGRDVMDGYRRGGVRAVGRRDSLSDSD